MTIKNIEVIYCDHCNPECDLAGYEDGSAIEGPLDRALRSDLMHEVEEPGRYPELWCHKCWRRDIVGLPHNVIEDMREEDDDRYAEEDNGEISKETL